MSVKIRFEIWSWLIIKMIISIAKKTPKHQQPMVHTIENIVKTESDVYLNQCLW